MNDNYKHTELSDRIIKAFYKVYNALGYGFLEKVYERALTIELQREGLKAVCQMPVEVYYEEERVGVYIADIVVEDLVIVEVKACEVLAEEHEAQLTNYLRATNIEVGLLLGFCKKPIIKRKVFTNERKDFRATDHYRS